MLPENVELVLGVLADLGLEYDSSFFPGHFSGAVARRPHRVRAGGAELCEIPATALHLGPLTLPVGGAYFRALPLAAARAMFEQCEDRCLPGVFYDLNPACHCPAGTPWKLRLMRRVGVRGALAKLEVLLRERRMTRIDAWLEGRRASLPWGESHAAR